MAMAATAIPPAIIGTSKWLAAPELAADLVDEDDGDDEGLSPVFVPVCFLEEASEEPDADMLEGDEVTLALENSVLWGALTVLACNNCDKADDSRALSEVSEGEELELCICKTFELEPDPINV